MKLQCLVAAAVLPSLIGVPASAAAKTATPPAIPAATIGNPLSPGALPQALRHAYAAGARRIVIRPGIYALPAINHNIFRLNGWKNAAIRAYGVTLIMHATGAGQNQIMFNMNHCRNVTLAGPTLSQSVVTAYQGPVVSMGTTRSGKRYADWRPDKGYPVPPANSTKFPGGDMNVVSARTRMLKVGDGDFYGLSMKPLGHGVFRLFFPPQKKLHFRVGDFFVGRYGNPAFKVHLNSCRDCTLQDITLLRNGFAPIREEGHGGGNHIIHCIWTLGPKPKGATESPLVTNEADGFHSTGANPGPDIERCIFRGVFLDDCIAIHGYFALIKKSKGRTFTLAGGNGGLKVGQPARISNENGFFAQGTVAAMRHVGKRWIVTLTKNLHVPAGAKVSNPMINGPGYKIIGCKIGGTRSRGVLLKADNGLVEDNLITGCGMPAVSLGPEYYWNEADYVWHVRVIGNKFVGNGAAGYGGPAIFIHGHGAIGNRNIVVANNRFVSNYQGDIQAQWARGLKISRNAMQPPRTWPGGITPRPPAISIANCRNVILRGNSLTVMANHPHGKRLSVGPNVKGLHGKGPRGIRLVIRKQR